MLLYLYYKGSLCLIEGMKGINMRKIKSKHNNLMNYFICDHKDLSKAYVKKSEKFLKEISDRLKKRKEENK